MQLTGELYRNNKISRDLPMAAFSGYPGNKENRVHFTVRWDVLKADGRCQVSRQGIVKNVDIIKFHNNRKNMTVTTTSQRRVMVSTTTGISESGATPMARCVTPAHRKTVSWRLRSTAVKTMDWLYLSDIYRYYVILVWCCLVGGLQCSSINPSQGMALKVP